MAVVEVWIRMTCPLLQLEVDVHEAVTDQEALRIVMVEQRP